jgi:hypothetical protein
MDHARLPIAIRLFALLAFVLAAGGCDLYELATPQGRFQHWERELNAAQQPIERFYSLGEAAKAAFDVGEYDKARDHATELEGLAPSFVRDWNYGNAIQDFNIVEGRLALHEGRIDDAKAHLLAAGRSRGSPQMDSFGPNMSLARDLLEKGERATVLEYFGLCRKFWKTDRGRLDEWTDAVKAGEMPDFDPASLIR